MTPRKLDVLITYFCYGGNGGVNSVHPDIMLWLIKAIPEMNKDPRIGRVCVKQLSDTPITLTRNQAVVAARKGKFDLLLMLDSDQAIDLRLGWDKAAKPFWDSSFSFIYDNWDKGPRVVAAPYCGMPPDECVFIFRWRNHQSDSPDDQDMQLQMYSREEAAERVGIEACGALPTGVSLWDVRCFDITEPKKEGDKPWFYYETNLTGDVKQSTEDVTATRDMALMGYIKLGYNPVFVNWDSWAGHWKPKCVGKPHLLPADAAAQKLANAAISRMKEGEAMVSYDFDAGINVDHMLRQELALNGKK